MTKSGIFTPNEIKAENGLQLGKVIFEHTPVIYYLNKKGRPEPVASAFALKFEDDHFIVTASHTLRNFEDYSLGIVPGARWIELNGEHAFSDSEKIDEDKLDVAVFKLQTKTVQEIAGQLKFFDLKGFYPDHEDVEGNSYAIVGHPVTKVKLNHAEGKQHLSPFMYLSDLNQQDKMFANQGFSKLTHQLFNYRRRRIYDFSMNMVQGPKPNGLSGSGLWKFSDLIEDDYRSIKYFPTGVVIEYIREYSALVITRINVVTEIIRRHFNANVRPSVALKDGNDWHKYLEINWQAHE